MLEICQRLQNTDVATALRESQYAYPLIEGLHVIGIGISAGLIMWADLSVAGLAMRRAAAPEIVRSLRPWMYVGLAVSALTGLALFVGHAEVVYRSAYFGAHVALAVLALFNVAILQRVMAGNAKEHAPARSGRARVLAVVDLALWTGVIALPRLMS